MTFCCVKELKRLFFIRLHVKWRNEAISYIKELGELVHDEMEILSIVIYRTYVNLETGKM